MLVMPKSRRPTKSTAKMGAQLCRKRHAVARTSVPTVNHLGEKRDVAQLSGTAKAMLPQWEAEPNRPCCPGERFRSALMAGRRIPRVLRTMNEDTLENSQTLITAHL